MILHEIKDILLDKSYEDSEMAKKIAEAKDNANRECISNYTHLIKPYINKVDEVISFLEEMTSNPPEGLDDYNTGCFNAYQKVLEMFKDIDTVTNKI